MTKDELVEEAVRIIDKLTLESHGGAIMRQWPSPRESVMLLYHAGILCEPKLRYRIGGVEETKKSIFDHKVNPYGTLVCTCPSGTWLEVVLDALNATENRP